ncbi:MAG: hypothetical protein M1816_007195 [Peltula sp. TS41687]|nr:MAG: hypothetical protein M1816_007195 [Peltula sp. TS41687]
MATTSQRDPYYSWSSWDRCMSRPYCKWPLIAGCIVGGLFLVGLLFGCLRCCICRPPRPRPSNNTGPFHPPLYVGPPYGEYQQPYSQPSPYQPQPPPFYLPHVPQYDSGRGSAINVTVNADALPPMPNWDSASQRRIPVEVEPQQQQHAVELGHLDASTGRNESPFTNNSQVNYYGDPANNVNPDTYRAPSGYQRSELDLLSPQRVASPSSPSPGVGLSAPVVQGLYGHPGEPSPIHTMPAHEVSPMTPHQPYAPPSIEFVPGRRPPERRPGVQATSM